MYTWHMTFLEVFFFAIIRNYSCNPETESFFLQLSSEKCHLVALFPLRSINQIIVSSNF